MMQNGIANAIIAAEKELALPFMALLGYQDSALRAVDLFHIILSSAPHKKRSA